MELRVEVLNVAIWQKIFFYAAGILTVWITIRQWAHEWRQKRKLRRMLRRISSIRQLEKGIEADRSTTERLLLSLGAKKSNDDWTLNTN